MPRHYNLLQSRFFCTKCGKEGIPVNRKKGQEREGGHLKRLYCLFCGEEINHAEIRNNDTGNYSYEDFKTEFELGRFVNGERIPINELTECTNLDCPFNIDGRCWNANNSEKCRHKRKESDNNE